MAWKTLGESLEAALASMMNEVGDGDVGASPDAGKLPKGTGADEGPGQVVVREVKQREKPTEATQPGKAPASPAVVSRKQRIAPGSPIPVAAGPMPAVRCFLVIEGGGGRPTGGGDGRAAYRAAAGRERARELLKLVHGSRPSL